MEPVAAPKAGATALVALVLVYLVWGSTFLAIRWAVRGEGGVPPMQLGAMRMALASALLFAICAGRGDSLRLTPRGLARAAAAGLLMWVGGNGLVIVAVSRMDSGLVAVLMATTPIAVAVLIAVRQRRAPPRGQLVGLGLGLAGVAMLFFGAGSGGIDGLGVALSLGAALSFAIGSLLPAPSTSPVLSAAHMLWFAAVGFSVASAALGEPLVVPSGQALIALGYLVVVGTAIGFVAFLVAMSRLPPALVMTHAYVNPLIAVVLGVIFAGESVSLATAVAAALILVSVPLNRSSPAGR